MWPGVRGSFGEIGQERFCGLQPLFTLHGLFSHVPQTTPRSFADWERGLANDHRGCHGVGVNEASIMLQ